MFCQAWTGHTWVLCSLKIPQNSSYNLISLGWPGFLWNLNVCSKHNQNRSYQNQSQQPFFVHDWRTANGLITCMKNQQNDVIGLCLLYLTPLSTMFQLYRGVSVLLMEEHFIGESNRNIRRKPPICRKSLTHFITYSYIEYTSPRARFERKTLVGIGTACTSSFIANYHTITNTTVP